ncbi:glycoside hydrolase family 127 protein [Rhizobium sp. SSA_523]|uniref:glycoside hydrolase family 127 protein n=1 Tax=Rhizobium sp. SSA_523 TaxID=2952477 RepID=UPI002091A986|nr:beta-L-arabinofuranosidase domain-containing protein [Rhizobium sp. SSA_523]MCO5731231.1 glycoside hydrolase family 127 protein [Rhizobium sp. SSA_523]WKC22229.1 glycoside hydrolase family 127 protein [Rhizobium sp. SSA_523]
MTISRKDRQFRPVAVPDVKIAGFWGKWQDAVCRSTAATLLDRCVEAGMVRAIDVDQPSPGIVIPILDWGGTTQMFWDSDLGKSIETIAYSLYRAPNPVLEARADAIIDLYEKLQDKDGYVNAWFQRVQPERRWKNLRDHHELYCAGHLIEAAVAYYQATGKRKLLDIMCRYADYMIKVFGHGPGQIAGYDGHQEIELALVKLARVTGETKYLALSRFFIDERGTEPHFFTLEAERDGRDTKDYIQKSYEYGQAHRPVREQKKVVGHAVRAMYMYSAMADLATEYRDDSLTNALEALWDDLVSKQMYITGGIGPAASNEGFTDYYDLPNDTAYAETCASVGLVFWASRMLGRGPDRRYGDIMEQALYNGALPGLAIDGKTFFYDNPLESTGKHHRWRWHHCPCCPPNIARLVTSIGSYMYAVADDEIAVHLYGESSLRCTLANGADLSLKQSTDYPWDGKISFELALSDPASFALWLRIPEWAGAATLSVNGQMLDLSAAMTNGYARINREWRDGDRVALLLPLALRPQYSNPKVRQDAGRVALMRGPMVYCAEEVDNGGDLNAIVVPQTLPEASTQLLADLNGAVAVTLAVEREDTEAWGEALYRATPAQRRPADLRLVPYHLWDNRAPGSMLVWFQAGK